MNCRDIERLLAEGRPLGPEAQEHLRDCAECGALLEILDQRAEPIGSETLRSIMPVLPSPSSVKPLPADAPLVAFTMSVFVLFSLVVAAIAGFQGYLHLTPLERGLYYAVILWFGVLFSLATAQAAIPGAQVRVPGDRVIGGSILGVALLVTFLFRTFALNDFVHKGIPCLRLGCICAALFGLLAGTLLRRGYVTNIRQTSLLVACFAGFAGVAVLSLQCPIQNAAHIIVWHLGAIGVSAFGGLVAGSILKRMT